VLQAVMELINSQRSLLQKTAN